MKHASKVLFALAFLMAAAPQAAQAWQEDERTVNRSITGEHLYPEWIVERPEHYPFLPDTSNHDAQNQHPQQWQGQEWDPSMWNAGWTAETAIRKFYQGRIFQRQYIRNKKIPVLVVGPTFYKLSDLDRRRTVKLLIDHSDIFNRGFDIVELRDWHNGREIGSYTRKGLQLN